MILFCILVGLISQGCRRGLRISPDELGEPDHPSLLAAKPKLIWRTRLSSPPVSLTPLGPGVLLITTHRGELYRLNLETGKRAGRMWHPLRKSITAQLVHQQGPHLYIASSQEDKLWAYHLERSRVLWKRRAAGISGQLGLVGRLLLAASLTGKVAAYDITNGHLHWYRQLPGRIYQGVWIFDDRALVLNDAGALYAFSLRDPTDAILAEGDQTDESYEDYPHLWQRQLPVSPSAVVGSGEGQLVIGDSDGRLLVVDPADGEMVFQTQLAAPLYSRPLIADGLVVVATAAGEIIALKSSDGFPVWRVQGEGLVRIPLLALGGRTPRTLLVPFARGRLLALELTTGRELWHYDIPEPIENASLIPGGIVVVDRQKELFHLQLADSTARRSE